MFAYMYVKVISQTIYKVRSAYFSSVVITYTVQESLTSWRNSFFEELDANAGAAVAATVLYFNIVAAAAIAAIVVSIFFVVLISFR